MLDTKWNTHNNGSFRWRLSEEEEGLVLFLEGVGYNSWTAERIDFSDEMAKTAE